MTERGRGRERERGKKKEKGEAPAPLNTILSLNNLCVFTSSEERGTPGDVCRVLPLSLFLCGLWGLNRNQIVGGFRMDTATQPLGNALLLRQVSSPG